MMIHLSHNGTNLGTFAKDQVLAMLQSGMIQSDTLAWVPGQSQWRPVREIVPLPKPPPLPAPPPLPSVPAFQAPFPPTFSHSPATHVVQPNLLTREEWHRRVREAELAVAELERKSGIAPVWRENLRQMKANPPKTFAPSRSWAFIGRALLALSPQTLDNIIIREARQAGHPLRLPPCPGALQECVDNIVSTMLKEPLAEVKARHF